MRGLVRSGILHLIRRARYDAAPPEPTDATLLAAPVDALSPKRPVHAALSEWDFARMLPARFPQRVFVNGFPGAGNVILHHVSGALLNDAALTQARREDDSSR